MAKRTRKTPEQARREILTTAEELLVSEGPDALKLERIAAEMGTSHSRILHHFGDREGLIAALLEHCRDKILNRSPAVLSDLEIPGDDTEDWADFLGELANALIRDDERSNIPHLLAALKVYGVKLEKSANGLYADIVEAVHEGRRDRYIRTDREPPTREDSQFLIVLFVFAMFAEGVMGKAVRKGVGLKTNVATRTRFWNWFMRTIAYRNYERVKLD